MQEIIPIACDHAGYELKLKVIEHLKSKGFEVKDFGTDSTSSCDYPDYAHQVGSALERGDYRRGIVICGSGKYPHVRCALCWTPEIARLARQHNDANCISMPARFISEETAMQIVDEYLDTPFEGGRHTRRVEKISQLI